MTTQSHYSQAEHTLRRAEVPLGAPTVQELAIGQLHALISIADELRSIRNELTQIRQMTAAAQP